LTEIYTTYPLKRFSEQRLRFKELHIIRFFPHNIPSLVNLIVLLIVVGGRPKAEAEKQGVFGKESMHKESDN
jgi:hypothetical protein